jgi:predicted ABC-type ATPase
VGQILVLAGTNGSGKSSVAGAFLRSNGGTYFDPDEVARSLTTSHPSLAIREANSLAWHEGKRRLETAIAAGAHFNLESTLGGQSITRLLQHAIDVGSEVVVWYVALANPELHLERVRARVAEGGHAIAAAEIRKRYDTSRLNLIELMPGLAELRVHDNSKHADLAKGEAPDPRLILAMTKQKVVDHCPLAIAPAWAKPILAAAFAIDPAALQRWRF